MFLVNFCSLNNSSIIYAAEISSASFNNLSIEDGLPDNYVRKIIQDDKGFIWVATGQGLSRYDGISIKSYFYDLNINNAISSNSVKTIFEDADKALWVGTTKGLNKLNKNQTGFSYYINDSSKPESLSNNIVTAISQDNRGRLWVGTNNGLNLLENASTGKFKRFLYSEESADTALKVNFIRAYQNSILVGTTAGLYIYDTAKDDFTAFKDKYPSFVPSLTKESNYLSSFVDSNDTLWLAVDEIGVFYQTKDSVTFNQLSSSSVLSSTDADANTDTDNGINYPNNLSNIKAINEDKDGNIWFGSQTDGLLIYYPDIKITKSIKVEIFSKNLKLSKPEINSILRDHSGLMWVGTTNIGTLSWDPRTVYIQHYDKEDLTTSTEPLDSAVWTFSEHPNGEIYLATYSGLKVFDPQTEQLKKLSIKEKHQKSEPETLRVAFTQTAVWIATHDSLIKYIPGKGVTERITSESNSFFALPKDAYVTDIQIINDLLYIAFLNKGLFVVDFENETIREIPIEAEASSKKIMPLSLLHSKFDDSLWILSLEGLFNYSPTQDRIRLGIQAGIDKLSNGHVSSLYQDSLESVWIGTSGNGINHIIINDFEKGTYEINQFSQINELKYQVVNGLVIDDVTPNNLWISTHSGLLQLNLSSMAVRKFSARQGVQAKEFNEGAYFKDSRNLLYFGGINGFNRINPEKLVEPNNNPPLRITHFSVHCSDSETNCADNLIVDKSPFVCEGIECNLEGLETLLLPTSTEHVEFSFASLDYANTDYNQYRYRLYTSKVTAWINLQNENTLLFNNLKPEKYTLEIEGSNGTGLWSEQSVKIKFNIAPAWYQEDYIYLTEFILFLFSLFLLLGRYRQKERERVNIELAIQKSEENFKFALWGSGDELWEWHEKDNTLLRTNPIIKYAVSVVGREPTLEDFFEGIHPDDREKTLNIFKEHLKGERSYFEALFRIKNDKGIYLWVMSRGRVVERDLDNRAVRMLGSTKDITRLKATEDKLELIAKAFDNTMDGISILDHDFKSVLNNQAFYDITNLTLAESINTQYFFSENSDNHSKYQQIKITLRNFGEWEGEIWETRPNGERFAMELKIDRVLDTDRQVSNYICIFSDITYRKQAEEELRKLANYDSLTNLPNRSLFMDRLSHALAHAKRNKHQFALLFIDLDHFKNINDSLGHSIGDELLRKVAQRLVRCIRDTDTVARLGGDEFVIILENVRHADEVGVCAAKIIRRMQKSIDVNGTILKTSPSIGIGIYPEDGEDKETLLKNADIAMYSAKESGRNNYKYFSADMTSSAVARLDLENKLREAIEKNQFVLYYQPKLLSQTGKLTGFEALIRWIHPEDGMISPAAFIPIAEETGIILPMGDWILEEAISQAKVWSEINSEACSIAINISARQFQQGNLSDTIANLLDKYDLDPKYIELEITEGTLMSNMDHAISTLNKLREMGVCLSLDDFGTGYSSLTYLKRFPVNKLKVDQSFVRDITTDPGDASIVASIISLAHNLGLTVIAEGCETLAQLSFICSYHCEEVQGYLFSRPVPKEEAETILKEGKIQIDR